MSSKTARNPAKSSNTKSRNIWMTLTFTARENSQDAVPSAKKSTRKSWINKKQRTDHHSRLTRIFINRIMTVCGTVITDLTEGIKTTGKNNRMRLLRNFFDLSFVL